MVTGFPVTIFYIITNQERNTSFTKAIL